MAPSKEAWQRVELGSGQLLTKRSSIGIHVFELAFEHTGDILGMFGIYTYVLFDSHVSVQLPMADGLCFGVTSLNRLQPLQPLTDFSEIL